MLLSDYYLIPTTLDGLSTNGVMHYMDTIENTYSKYCVNGEDAIVAKHFFGDSPKLIGIFYDMIRGQVNYVSDDTDFRCEMSARTARKRAETRTAQEMQKLPEYQKYRKSLVAQKSIWVESSAQMFFCAVSNGWNLCQTAAPLALWQQ